MKIYVDNERDELSLIRTLKFVANELRLDQDLHEIIKILDSVTVLRVSSELVQSTMKKRFVVIDKSGVKKFGAIRSNEILLGGDYQFSVDLSENIIEKVEIYLKGKAFNNALSLILHAGKGIMWENFDAGCMKVLQKFI